MCDWVNDRLVPNDYGNPLSLLSRCQSGWPGVASRAIRSRGTTNQSGRQLRFSQEVRILALKGGMLMMTWRNRAVTGIVTVSLVGLLGLAVSLLLFLIGLETPAVDLDQLL